MKPRRKTSTQPDRSVGAPFLRRVFTLPERVDPKRYPFNIGAFSRGIDLEFRTNVTFFVGENGSGKSTLLEALAECCGFNPEGGSRDHQREALVERSELAQALRLSWLPKVAAGFFMRAESFYNFATYLAAERHPQPGNARPCPVPHRDALAHPPQLPGGDSLQPGRRFHPTDRLPRDRALPRHSGFPQFAGALLPASVSRRV